MKQWTDLGLASGGSISAGAQTRVEKRERKMTEGSDILRDSHARVIGTGAVLALLIWVVVGTLLADGRANRITDQGITEWIQMELLLDGSVPVRTVHVESLRGIVTLSGAVGNLLARERATQLAASTKGVRAVINDLEVHPEYRSDEDLQQDIYAALGEDPVAHRYDVEATVISGAAVLTGTVQSQAEKELAGELARGVRGIKLLVNEIAVAQGTSQDDRDLWATIHRRLSLDTRLKGSRIELTVDGGQVTLIGTVPSVAQRSLAAAQAWLPGVRHVDVSNLRVSWDDGVDVQQAVAHTEVSDATIKAAVQDALFYDPRVLSFNIYARVKKGVVHLSGLVDNYRAKLAAEEDAENTVGVWLVKNSIRVRSSSAPIDPVLQKRIRNAFERDPYLEPSDVSVHTIDGIAYIEGVVNSPYTRERIERVASQVSCVKAVVSKVSCDDSRTRLQDAALENTIAAQLTWSPFVGAGRISVQVSDGIVTLLGVADSWSEQQEAALIAIEGGARDVKNRIAIRPKDGWNAGAGI